jgi:hypothetical protein
MPQYRRRIFPRRVKIALWVIGTASAITFALWAANTFYQMRNQ